MSCRTAPSITEGLGITEGGTEEYRGSLNGQCEGYARCEPDTTGGTDCVHRSGGSRAPTLWVPIIHPCWSGGMPVLVEDAAEAVASVDVEAGGSGRLGDR